MKKTGAVMSWWVLGFILAGAWAKPAVAQVVPPSIQLPEAAPATEPETAAPPATEVVVESPPRLPPDQRLAELKFADLDALKAAQDDCLKAAEDLTKRIPELHREARAAYEEARNSPEAQAVQRQIKDLEAQLVRILQTAPAVLEKQQAIDQARQDMLAELRLRTTCDGQEGGRGQDRRRVDASGHL